MTLQRAGFFTGPDERDEPPADEPRIPRHRKRDDRRPWIRHAGPELERVAPPLRWDGDYGCYVLADQRADCKRGDYYTRASSYGKGLQAWDLVREADIRRVVWALGQHPHLHDAAQAVRTLDDPDDRRELKRIGRLCTSIAGADLPAIGGTAFHKLRERRDAGEDLEHCTDRIKAGLRAWDSLTSRFELLASEVFVVNRDKEAAGSLDVAYKMVRTEPVVDPKTGEVLGHLERGENVVGDLKSGKHGLLFVGSPGGCQLCIYDGATPYSHDAGDYPWNWGEFNHRFAAVITVSPDRPEEAKVSWVPLEAARWRLELAEIWRKAQDCSDLFVPAIEEAPPEAEVDNTGLNEVGFVAELRAASSPHDVEALIRRFGDLLSEQQLDRARARWRELGNEKEPVA